MNGRNVRRVTSSLERAALVMLNSADLNKSNGWSRGSLLSFFRAEVVRCVLK